MVSRRWPPGCDERASFDSLVSALPGRRCAWRFCFDGRAPADAGPIDPLLLCISMPVLLLCSASLRRPDVLSGALRLGRSRCARTPLPLEALVGRSVGLWCCGGRGGRNNARARASGARGSLQEFVRKSGRTRHGDLDGRPSFLALMSATALMPGSGCASPCLPLVATPSYCLVSTSRQAMQAKYPPRGNRFEGKVAVITGAAGNFGSVTARMMAAEGIM